VDLWDQADRLHDYGTSLRSRFEDTGNFYDISTANLAHQRAVQLTPDGHASMPGRLGELGNTLTRRFLHTGDLSDISTAISAHQRAVQLTPDGHAGMPGRLNNLGISFWCRFGHTGHLPDISVAISVQQRALQLATDGNPDVPVQLNSLGISFMRRFEHTGDLSDISNAISTLQKAVQLTPDGHVLIPSLLNNLGNSFKFRFGSTRDLPDISNAISILQRAVRLTPDGHADMPGMLSALGSSLTCRFERTGDLPDISNAISTHQRAIQLTPDGHANMPDRLSELGCSLTCRFERTDDLSDISTSISTHQRAIQLTPDGDAGMPDRLNHLGTSFRVHFQRTGDLHDISSAISAHQKAIQLTVDGHLSMPGLLNDLGISFLSRFERTGDLYDVSNAISTLQKAVQLSPFGHTDMPCRLSNLGVSFRSRFVCTGDLPDISSAVSALQRAVQLTPDGHADLPGRLNSLGNSLSCRFKRTGDISDVSAAISSQQRAVQLAPDGHVKLSGWLNSLGNTFARRFERTGDLHDISSAISTQQRAVQLIPDDHAEMPHRLSNLGVSFAHGFLHTGDLSDISSSISALQRAIQLTPEGHADMSGQLSNLGRSFFYRYGLTSDSVDFHEAMSSYGQSATYPSGAPSIHLASARQWANLSSSGDSSQSLHAYGVAIDLLSKVAGMDRTIYQRHTSLVGISSLTTAAASAAFAQGEGGKALEWLEHGRCIVWNQINQLRTPVDDLRAHDKLLADRFLYLSRVLESSGSRRESTIFALDTTISKQIALQDEAQSHVEQAKEWGELLDKIRMTPGFHDFLRPRSSSSILKDLPKDGPVILINVHEDRCDALALIPSCDEPLHIPLIDFTHQAATKLRDRLRRYLLRGGNLTRQADRGPREVLDPDVEKTSEIRDVLHELWLCVVKPILDGLAYSVSLILRIIRSIHLLFTLLKPRSDPARIWWCPTGPLAFLPIHAAGIYSHDRQSPGSCISDFVISSYTPTVSALLEKLKASDTGRQPVSKVLLISQPSTPGLPPIHGTTREVNVVSKIIALDGCESLLLEGSRATVTCVKEEMKSYRWVHFTCHASQNIHNPLRSAFFLHDGRLELGELVKQRIPQCELAFLSACQTSTGDEKLSEEAVHLAAGMLAVGYQGVVGTMWSIKDRYAPKVSEAFYDYLVVKRRNTGNQGLDSTHAAYALHHAIQVIRKDIGDTEYSLLTWVPYVHFGL